VLAGLFGGLGLFLVGLRQLTDGLKQLAGDRLRVVLARLTGNRVLGLLTGAGVTALVQSSSVTTVVAVGFVSAGVLGVTQALSVVLGANVGTTITAQAVAFDIESWAMVLVAVGALGTLRTRRDRWQPRAAAVFGIGLVFVGMQVMSTSMSPLRTDAGFVELMADLESPLLGLLVGAAFTAVVQSSSATTALVITLAAGGLVSLDAGVALVIGANVGTCVTAGLAAIGKSRPAIRVAVAHVLINLLGALVWIGATGVLADLAVWMPGDSSVARQLANAHTVFNLSVALVLLPLLGPVERLLDRLVPDRVGAPRVSALDHRLLPTPALALAAARVELGHLAARVAESIPGAAVATVSGGWTAQEELQRGDDEIDDRYREIVEYLADIGQETLSEEQADELLLLLAAADDVESMGDIVEINLATLGQRRLERGTHLGTTAVRHVLDTAAEVARAVTLMSVAIAEGDQDAARRVVAMKPTVNGHLGRAFTDQAHRLVAEGTDRLAAFALERDMLESLRRVYYFAKRVSAAELARVAGSATDQATPDEVDEGETTSADVGGPGPR
jgi:phosphate:Na+ symporter